MKPHPLLPLALGAALVASAADQARAACAGLAACWTSAQQARTLTLELRSGDACGGGICVVAYGQQQVRAPLGLANYRFEQVPFNEGAAPTLVPAQPGGPMPAVLIPTVRGAAIQAPPAASTFAVLFRHDPGKLAPDTTYALLSLTNLAGGQKTPFAIGLRNGTFMVGQAGPAGAYWRPLRDPAPLGGKAAWIALFVTVQADGKLLLAAYRPRSNWTPPPFPPVELAAGLLDAGWPIDAYPARGAPKPYLPVTNLALGAPADAGGLGAPLLPGFSRLMMFGKALEPGERGAVMTEAMPVGRFMLPDLDFDAPAGNSGAHLQAYLPDMARTLRFTNEWKRSPTASVLSRGPGAPGGMRFSGSTPDRALSWFWHGGAGRPPPYPLVAAERDGTSGNFVPEDLGLNTYRLRSWSGALTLTNLDGRLVMDRPAAAPTPAQTWLVYAPPPSGPPPATPAARTDVTFMSALDGRIVTLGPVVQGPPLPSERGMLLSDPAQLPDGSTWTVTFERR